jgi:FlaA1/EpsC-like NDP-sugar epimerase
MYQQDSAIVRRIEIFADVLLSVLVFIGVYLVKQNLFADFLGGQVFTHNYSMLLLMIMFIWYVTLDVVNRKRNFGVKITGSMITEIWKGVSISTVILVLSIYFFKIQNISRLLILLFYLVDLTCLILVRYLFYRFISSKRNNEYFHRHILIIGSRMAAQELIQL